VRADAITIDRLDVLVRTPGSFTGRAIAFQGEGIPGDGETFVVDGSGGVVVSSYDGGGTGGQTATFWGVFEGTATRSLPPQVAPKAGDPPDGGAGTTAAGTSDGSRTVAEVTIVGDSISNPPPTPADGPGTSTDGQ
jgi:hypothetical protein